MLAYKVTIVGLFLATFLAATSGLPATIDRYLVETFEKVNNFLEENVETDDLQENLELADIWMDEQNTPVMQQTLRMFLRLPRTIENVTTCSSDNSRRLIENFDAALSDEEHLSSKNYQFKRFDRILELVAYKHVRLCRLEKNRPELRFAFKTLAYDKLDPELAELVPDDRDAEGIIRNAEDAERIMGVAKELLQKSEDKEGSYAKALELLLSMETILTETACNEHGLEIVVRNDLATKGESRRPGPGWLRRVSRVVNYYSTEHSKICHPIYERNCLKLIEKLDEQTYRRVLALASAAQLKVQLFDEMIQEVDGKQCDEDFTSKFVARRERVTKISIPAGSLQQKILPYLRAATKKDARNGALQVTGNQLVRKDEIEQLYNEFIHEPCEKFTNIMSSDMEIFNYNFQLIKLMQVEDNSPLKFRLLHSAFYTCQSVLTYQKYYIDNLIEKVSFSG